MNDSITPETNKDIYCFLFQIENVLWELIVDKLSNKYGQFWYKHRLPGDILGKYRSSLLFEKNIPWTQMIPHH
jgi:hypothetical protein